MGQLIVLLGIVLMIVGVVMLGILHLSNWVKPKYRSHARALEYYRGDFIRKVGSANGAEIHFFTMDGGTNWYQVTITGEGEERQFEFLGPATDFSPDDFRNMIEPFDTGKPSTIWNYFHNQGIIKAYGACYRRKQGWSLGYDNYDLRSFDGGRTWWAVESDIRNDSVKLLGPAEEVHPGLLDHLVAIDNLYRYVEENGSIVIGSGTTPEEMGVLENAGFELVVN